MLRYITIYTINADMCIYMSLKDAGPLSAR